MLKVGGFVYLKTEEFRELEEAPRKAVWERLCIADDERRERFAREDKAQPQGSGLPNPGGLT